MKKQILLITATVTPQANMPNLKVVNPQERVHQYLESIRFLVQSGATSIFEKIYLAENSGYDLTLFRHALIEAKCEVELVSIQPRVDGRVGRCLSEFLLIDDAMKVESLAQALERGCVLWKITGRYSILNLNKIVSNQADYDININMRRYPKKWADLFLFSFNRRGWESIGAALCGFTPENNTGLSEVDIYDVINSISNKNEVTVQRRLPFEPHIVGVRGYDGHQYDSGSQRLKRIVRKTIRLVAPKLEI